MAIDLVKVSGGVDLHLWLPRLKVEGQAMLQLERTARLPWAVHVAVMPDCHHGAGATVGSVIGLKGAVSPAAVGVDIGCGMVATRTSLDFHKVQKKLSKLRSHVEELIPVGFNHHVRLDQLEMPEIVDEAKTLFAEFPNLDFHVRSDIRRVQEQCGSLGGGNHFIELCVDTGRCDGCLGTGDRDYGNVGCEVCHECGGTGKRDPAVWMMLHSGSRWVGKELAEVHMARAADLLHNKDLEDKALSVFLAGTPEMEAYRRDLYWAQRYALLNRRVMNELYKRAIRSIWPGTDFGKPIMCHHNYVAEEHHCGEDLFVTRKGAIRAGVGEMGIIPGSMGTKSYIVRGLGNPEALLSAPHGAGRKMSRSQARKKFSLNDLKNQTQGVECRKDKDVIDEIPGAYKPIEEVMSNSADLVEVVAELKGLMCVKG